MESLPHVYIAGPYTKPDPIANMRRAITLGMHLYRERFAFPVIPHVSGFVDFLCPMPYENWLEFDLHALIRCDALYRFEGASSGADAEVRFALEHGITVFDREHDRNRDVEFDLTTWCEMWKANHVG